MIAQLDLGLASQHLAEALARNGLYPFWRRIYSRTSGVFRIFGAEASCQNILKIGIGSNKF